MKLKLNGFDIELPPFETVEERIEFSDMVLDKYPDNFKPSGFEKADKKIYVRLDILGTYILQVDKENKKDIMTQYKIKARKTQEPVLSSLPKGVQWHVGNEMFSH